MDARDPEIIVAWIWRFYNFGGRLIFRTRRAIRPEEDLRGTGGDREGGAE